MAQRRMFSPDIVQSDAFLEMAPSTQALYFQLGMRADDDGFVNPKVVMRIIGSTEDELKVLIAKRFVLPFESGVIVIKHWRINNFVRKDRYRETNYLTHKERLYVKPNQAYSFNDSEGALPIAQVAWKSDKEVVGQPTVNQRSTQVRLGKDRLLGEEKPSQEEEEIIVTSDDPDWKVHKEPKDTSYLKVFELWGKYPLNWKTNRTEIGAAKNLLAEHGIEKCGLALSFVKKYGKDEMCPQILKPSDLDRKWGNLMKFRDKVL